MKQVAHFFWQGELSLYEHKCIESFVKNNFDVMVWSYHELTLPSGATLCNANDILPKTELNTFKVWNHTLNTFVDAGSINSGFSDLFRYNLLLKHGGWWFDTDVVCLKDQSEFALLTDNRHIVVGKQTPTSTNGAVLNFPDKETNQLALDKCLDLCQNARSFAWGDVGPHLITDFVREQNVEDEVYDIFTFYPIHWEETELFFNPMLKQRATELCKDSYAVHLWNWILTSRLNIDKNTMPPPDSYLHTIFSK